MDLYEVVMKSCVCVCVCDHQWWYERDWRVVDSSSQHFEHLE